LSSGAHAALLADPPPSPDDPTVWVPVGDDVVVGVRGPVAEHAAPPPPVRAAPSGYRLLDPTMGIRGSYTLRMVTTGNYTAMADELQRAATALSQATGAKFTVGTSTANEVPGAGQITVKLSSS